MKSGLKAAELRQRNLSDLVSMAKQMREDLFNMRFQNFTNRLDDTSKIRKARRDIARVLQVTREKSKSAGTGGA